jgi:hypothetical protein
MDRQILDRRLWAPAQHAQKTDLQRRPNLSDGPRRASISARSLAAEVKDASISKPLSSRGNPHARKRSKHRSYAPLERELHNPRFAITASSGRALNVNAGSFKRCSISALARRPISLVPHSV